MRRPLSLVIASGLIVALMLLSSAGCVLGEPDSPITGEPAPSPTEPTPALPAAPPDTPAADTVLTEIGEVGAAGAWSILVREATIEGGLLRVALDLTNTSGDALRVTPGDLTLTAGSTSIFPAEEGAHDLVSSREILAGTAQSLTVDFALMAAAADTDLTLAFAPSEGGPARIEIRIAQPQ